jgi:hypothetical protein
LPHTPTERIEEPITSRSANRCIGRIPSDRRQASAPAPQHAAAPAPQIHPSSPPFLVYPVPRTSAGPAAPAAAGTAHARRQALLWLRPPLHTHARRQHRLATVAPTRRVAPHHPPGFPPHLRPPAIPPPRQLPQLPLHSIRSDPLLPTCTYYSLSSPGPHPFPLLSVIQPLRVPAAR